MMVTDRKPAKIPDRISEIIKDEFPDLDTFVIKTDHKPNATIPILWLILYDGGILFCCTHKTRRIFHKYKKSDIDSFQVKNSTITVIHSSLDTDDWEIRMKSAEDCAILKKQLASHGYQLL